MSETPQLYEIISKEIDRQKAERKAPQIVFLDELHTLSGLEEEEIRRQLNALHSIGLIRKVQTINKVGVELK